MAVCGTGKRARHCHHTRKRTHTPASQLRRIAPLTTGANCDRSSRLGGGHQRHQLLCHAPEREAARLERKHSALGCRANCKGCARGSGGHTEVTPALVTIEFCSMPCSPRWSWSLPTIIWSIQPAPSATILAIKRANYAVVEFNVIFNALPARSRGGAARLQKTGKSRGLKEPRGCVFSLSNGRTRVSSQTLLASSSFNFKNTHVQPILTPRPRSAARWTACWG